MDKQYIIIYGGVVSGLCFIGPFPTHILAENYAEGNDIVCGEIAELDHPDTTEDE